MIVYPKHIAAGGCDNDDNFRTRKSTKCNLSSVGTVGGRNYDLYLLYRFYSEFMDYESPVIWF